MLKIDASFGEGKNGIRTQDLLNTSQTLLATAEATTGLGTEESKQVGIIIAAQAKGSLGTRPSENQKEGLAGVEVYRAECLEFVNISSYPLYF